MKKQIGNALYLIATILLLASLYFNVKKTESPFLEIAPWIMLLVAAVYAIWLKKSEESET